MTLWNDKSYDFINNCFPVLGWRRQPIQQLDKVSEGQRPEHLLNTPRALPNMQLRPIIYIYIYIYMCVCVCVCYFAETCNTSLRNPKKWLIDWCSTIAAPGLPLRFARIPSTVLSLRRHSSGPWDSAASIAAHSNALSRTMALNFKCLGSITIQGKHGNTDTIWGKPSDADMQTT